MKRGDYFKSGFILITAVILVAVYLHTQSMPLPDAPLGEETTQDTIALGDASTPDLPVLTYSAVYEEVSAKKRKRPRLNCMAALVVDNTSGEILYARRERNKRAIASLTKLMTAMVYLDTKPDLTRLVKITKEDARNSAKSGLRKGETFVTSDMLHAALMSSDNRAARTLVRAAGKTLKEFVALMNRKALELGLEDTHFEEVTGLSQENISTAYDCAILLQSALEYKLIREITTTQRYAFRSLDKGRWHRMTNSNRLVFSSHKITGGKTGYILRSGWCVATRAKDKNGHDITAIILGAPTNNQRFHSADRALRWGYQNAG